MHLEKKKHTFHSRTPSTKAYKISFECRALQMITVPRALHRKIRNYSFHKRCNVFWKNA